MKPEQAARLRQGRENAGLTQKQAAEALNVAPSTYRDWERPDGTEPASTTKLAETALLLNISLDWWITGKSCGPSLTKREHAILSAYRSMTKPAQQAIDVLAESTKK